MFFFPAKKKKKKKDQKECKGSALSHKKDYPKGINSVCNSSGKDAESSKLIVVSSDGRFP